MQDLLRTHVNQHMQCSSQNYTQALPLFTLINPTRSGSHITLELISRGHKVIGLSRTPSKLGTHTRYEPRTIDLENGTIDEISKTLTDLNVLICAYGPHTSGLAALKYGTFPLPPHLPPLGHLTNAPSLGSVKFPSSKRSARSSSRLGLQKSPTSSC